MRPHLAARTNVGAALWRARKARALELADVEQALRIRQQYLRALEAGRFEEIEGTAYARLFLREYAEYLGLDGDRILELAGDRLRQHESIDHEPDERGLRDDEIASTRVLVWIDRAFAHVPGGLRRWAWVGALLVAIAFLLLRTEGGSKPVPLEPARAQASAIQPTPPDSRPNAVPAPATAPRASPPHAMLVELSAARGDCWVLVRAGTASAPIVFEGIVRQGGTVAFRGRTLWLRLGAPWNIVMRVDGHVTRGLPTRPGNLLVTPDGVKPAA